MKARVVFIEIHSKASHEESEGINCSLARKVKSQLVFVLEVLFFIPPSDHCEETNFLIY